MGRDKSLAWTDGSNDLFKYYKIQIYHVPSGRRVCFKAWVTNFSDSYQSNWNTEDVYGRMDPISTFQNTKRTINLEWDVVGGSQEEAHRNMHNCELLFAMLYPSYEAGGADNASNILQAPLFKIKFGNLIGAPGSTSTAHVKNAGLMGTLSGFDYTPDFEAGFFTPKLGTMYPQTISLSAEFQVLHNFPVGWEGKRFRSKKFPWGMGNTKWAGLRPSKTNRPQKDDAAETPADDPSLHPTLEETNMQQSIPIKEQDPSTLMSVDPGQEEWGQSMEVPENLSPQEEDELTGEGGNAQWWGWSD